MQIRAAVTNGLNEGFSIEEVELQEPGEGEILVEIRAAGICHTDSGAVRGRYPLGFPAVLGHEGAGIVIKTGRGVRKVKSGDHVGLTYGTCGSCEECRHSRPYGCTHMVKINFGGGMRDGTHRLSRNGKKISHFFAQSSFAQYAVVHESSAVLVEDRDIPFSVIAPMGCGVQTGAGIVLNQMKPGFGDSLAVFGCGTVGMSALMAARIAGCRIIIAVGGNDESLGLARELGATHTINRRTNPRIMDRIKNITGQGCGFAIDTTGVPEFARMALLSAAYSGRTAFAANCEINVNTGRDMANRTVYGVSEGNGIPDLFIPELLRYYREGRYPVDRLIRTYPFEEINKAFTDSLSGKVIKAVLLMPG